MWGKTIRILFFVAVASAGLGAQACGDCGETYRWNRWTTTRFEAPLLSLSPLS